ncbi:contractile injection system tape measure protein [Flavobacterium sp.]|uniref:contractile injection system tape measure protein n=1 Tax=Flavobacterium sp. TaxID=239 RepID=UPI003D6C5F8E
MEEINSHIVSSLKWNTTFDKKEEGFKVQERLSNWSKISLPREAANVFNELCPPEQSWRIQSLELDLGICDYSDLEFDLSTKIRSLLREKIAELIIYQNNQKQNLIAVYNKEKSMLENLTVFLLEGYLPWNYQNKEGSVNQIMAELLQNNLTEIIAIIKRTGLTHEEVRKRISWQFDEKNVNKIIAALEPNNSDSIIEFSSIMTNLQVKETIIQTSTASFKKNLYFFILNFLLLERGTLFNKLAFMKSSILQMANHYNIAYSELILLIENTILKLSDKTTQNNNFILSLKTLTQEYETQKKEHYKPEKTIDYWILFEQLVKNKTVRKSKTDKSNLNELIVALNNENTTRFNTIIKRILSTENSLISLIQDLNETAIKIVFSKLDTTPSSLNMDTIIYLNALSKTLKLKTNSAVLWEIGITFLHKNKNANHTAFLLHCVKELSKKNHLEPEQLLESFTNARIPAAIKNSNSTTIYTHLNTVYCNEIDNSNSNYPTIHFRNLMSKLELQLQKRTNKNALFIDLQRSLVKTISLHPKMAFEVMLSYENKDFLRKILPLILNRELLQLLVKTTSYKKTKLVQTIQTVYKTLNAKEKYDFPEELLTDDFILLSIQEIILHPEHNSSVFLETVFIELSKKVTNTKRNDYFQFITKLLHSRKIKSFGITTKRTFLNQLKNNSSIDIIEFALLMQSTSQQAQLELSSLLASNFEDAKFISLRKQDKKQSQNLIHYFLKNGIFLKNNWVKEHAVILIRQSKSFSKNEIIQDLNEVFWETVLKYSAYKGNEILFQKLLEKAFRFYLKNNISPKKHSSENETKLPYKMDNEAAIEASLIEKNTLNDISKDSLILNKTASNKNIKNLENNILFNGQKLSAKEKYEWYSLVICQKQIPVGFTVSGTFEIKDLLNEIIINEPKIFFRIIKNEFISEAQTDWLSRNISFNNLCESVSQLDRNKESYLKILEKFYTTLGSISIRGIAAKEIQSLLLRKLLKAAANDNWRIISVDKIWNELIWDVVTKKGIAKKNFLMDIEKHIYRLPLSLQLSFREVLNTEKQTIQNKQKTEVLAKIEKLSINKHPKSPVKVGIPVRNAGIVLLNNYVVMLFERLGLAKDNEFTTIEAQINAVQYLQYVVTGLNETEETYLPLNKVLCGLPLTHTIPDEIEISHENEVLINGLITAAISYWTAIGECTVNGFRGNWLVRDGTLFELEDRWELTVDKRPYDLLINNSPFAFSIIKYPWMDKPLHVNWPY